MTDTPIRLLIVDDHNLFRQGLTRILEDYPQLNVVGQAADGGEALAMVDTLQPDVVLMDLNMPVLSGPDATRRLSASHPATPVIILTVSERDADLFDAIKAGARGYLLKNVGMAELLDAVQRVHAGEAIIAPAMAGHLLNEFRKVAGPGSAETLPVEVDDLSEREVEVLRLVAQGLPNREIADALSLSEHTVKSHLANILAKLHLRSRAHAAAYAVQAGLVKDVQTGR
ncbi:MAG: response regulator transcription factor [Anaerolineae bacterium]|nr:response regulator transcription factor [Anaerolineae bacterium]MCB0237463.1 response regulator transcription factor [Anaerolineae bacterium]MCB0249494.1 response regulator transcription factor [Anaerolineae bacterium]MCB9141393.1 response regulator transcription factor [Anaerolineales bacterium]